MTRNIALRPKDTNPPARKVSRQHVDSLFNALVLALNLNPLPIITNDLVSVLGDLHNNIIMSIDDNPTDLIKLLKALCLWYLDMLRGKRPGRGSIPWAQWDMRSNAPTLLVPLLPFLTKHLVGWDTSETKLLHIQAIYGLLNSHRVIVTPLNVDINSITMKGINTPSYANQIPAALERLGITPTTFMDFYKAACAKSSLKVVTTSGPNGQATWTAHDDAQAVMKSRVLYNWMTEFLDKSDMLWIRDAMVGTVSTPNNLNDKLRLGDPLTGKIHAIEEWGGKTRLVAIVDYWTQATLTPLHDTVASLLKRLDSDGTFDQDKIIRRVRDWTKTDGIEMNSYDLTAATDRLPISFQVEILSYLFGDKQMAIAWSNIMTNRSFLAPDGTNIAYAVGQPMGAKSSFPMLGLAHHVITQIAAIDAGVAKYNKYVILGDDNTMTDSKVGKAYLAIMDKLGVPINLSKSVVHSPDLLTAGEICKRTFIKGCEITAFPVKLLVKATKAGHLLPDLQNVLHKRGWPVSKSNFLAFAHGLSDSRSVRGLALLNCVPLDVSGLLEKIDLPNNINFSKAFGDTIDITDEVIKKAHLYALVTEQLKRVDALLRSTELMAESISLMSMPDMAKVWPSHLFFNMNDKERLDAIALLPTLSYTHPIVLAADSEYRRVMSHLNGLRAGNADMVNKARNGLLDILRNSLHEMWLGESEKTSLVRRTLFNTTLNTLSRITSIDTTTGAKRELNFSLLLSYVQRMWSVKWQFDGELYINPVKSKVNISKSDATNAINSLFDNVSIKDMRL